MTERPNCLPNSSQALLDAIPVMKEGESQLIPASNVTQCMSEGCLLNALFPAINFSSAYSQVKYCVCEASQHKSSSHQRQFRLDTARVLCCAPGFKLITQGVKHNYFAFHFAKRRGIVCNVQHPGQIRPRVTRTTGVWNSRCKFVQFYVPLVLIVIATFAMRLSK